MALTKSFSVINEVEQNVETVTSESLKKKAFDGSKVFTS